MLKCMRCLGRKGPDWSKNERRHIWSTVCGVTANCIVLYCLKEGGQRLRGHFIFVSAMSIQEDIFSMMGRNLVDSMLICM